MLLYFVDFIYGDHWVGVVVDGGVGLVGSFDLYLSPFVTEVEGSVHVIGVAVSVFWCGCYYVWGQDDWVTAGLYVSGDS